MERYILYCSFIIFIIINISLSIFASEERLALLLEDINQIRKEENISAVGLTLIKNSEVIFADSLGISDIESKNKVNSNSMFRMGSISKSFVGLAALKAEELGFFKVTDEVNVLLESDFIENKWQSTHPVLVSHLLEHTAGFYDITADEFNHDSEQPISLEQAFLISPEARVSHWRPGTHHSYSNLGAPIVALLIERKSGILFELFVERYILKPLGMEVSSFLHDDYAKEHLVSGHNSSSEYLIPYWNIAFRPFGALNSSPSEMASFLQLLIKAGNYQGKQIFSDKQIKRMRTPKTTLSAKSGLEFGYGLGSYAVSRNGHLLYGHGGTTAGHLSEYRYSAKHKLGYMLAINANNDSAKFKLIKRVEQFLLSDVKPTSEALKVATEEFLQIYSGYYQHATTRVKGTLPILNLLDTKEIVQQDDSLQIKSLIRPTMMLLPLAKRFFKEASDPVATSALIKNKNGNLFLQTPESNYEKISSTFYWSRLLMAVTSIVIIFVGLLYALIWVPKKLMGKLPGAKNTWIRLLPLITLPILLIPVVLSILKVELSGFGYLPEVTRVAFVILTVTGLVLVLSSRKWSVSRTAKTNLLLTSLANSFFCIYFLT